MSSWHKSRSNFLRHMGLPLQSLKPKKYFHEVGSECIVLARILLLLQHFLCCPCGLVAFPSFSLSACGFSSFFLAGLWGCFVAPGARLKIAARACAPHLGGSYWSVNTVSVQSSCDCASQCMVGPSVQHATSHLLGPVFGQYMRPEVMRRPWSADSILLLWKSCVTFTLANRVLQQTLPSTTFDASYQSLKEKFLLKYMDADLERVFNVAPEPLDLGVLADYNQVIQKAANFETEHRTWRHPDRKKGIMERCTCAHTRYFLV